MDTKETVSLNNRTEARWLRDTVMEGLRPAQVQTRKIKIPTLRRIAHKFLAVTKELFATDTC